MNAACRDQPISFLRLERYLQGDTDTQERERVGAHLAACDVCRACFDELRQEVVELLPLPAAVRDTGRKNARAKARANRIWPQLTAALAIAAALALWARPRSVESPRLPAARVAIKGGELALEAIREHAGTIAADSRRFAQGDRLQIRVSCPPGPARHWDLVAFQAGQAFFPLLSSAPIACANGVTLPGAFTLDGTSAVDVCVVIAETAIDRARIAQLDQMHALGAACLRIELAGD